MSAVTTRVLVEVSYFNLGAKIQHSWFEGEVVGLHMPKLLMFVRITGITKPGPGRNIGETKCVPFNHGSEVLTRSVA